MRHSEHVKLERNTEASQSILSMAARRNAAHPNHSSKAAAFRDKLTASLKSLADDQSDIDQTKFWRLYKELSVERIDFAGIARAARFNLDWQFELPNAEGLEIAHTLNFDKWIDFFFESETNYCDNIVDYVAECKNFSPRTTFLLDESVFTNLYQQQFLSFAHEIGHEISHKAARRAIKATIAEICLDDERSLAELVRSLGSTLAAKICLSVRLVIRPRSIRTPRLRVDDTRHKILNFSIRTGNSPPPAMSPSRFASGWALVNINTNARRENYETIQRQKVSRNLRNTIREQRARARFNRGTQDHADYGGSWQPPGYRHPLSHHSLAQCA